MGLIKDGVKKHYSMLVTLDPDKMVGKTSNTIWSGNEILGHLIDSAIINHLRFLVSSFADNLVFEGYDQNRSVTIQNYQNRNWLELVELWQSINVHIDGLLEEIPAHILIKKHNIHNFDVICFSPLPKNKIATIQYLIEDYVKHTDHHIAQIKASPRKSPI